MDSPGCHPSPGFAGRDDADIFGPLHCPGGLVDGVATIAGGELCGPAERSKYGVVGPEKPLSSDRCSSDSKPGAAPTLRLLPFDITNSPLSRCSTSSTLIAGAGLAFY
jgi:hypothetical protein